jgi:hypothetical protein
MVDRRSGLANEKLKTEKLKHELLPATLEAAKAGILNPESRNLKPLLRQLPDFGLAGELKARTVLARL